MDMLRRRIGDFYTVEHIGSGGMSQVFLAVNPRTREKRAVKIVSRRATSPASDLVRFRREIEIIRSLNHSNIIRILEAGAEDGFCFYMMEYFADGSLCRKLSRGGIPLDEALPLFAGIVSAMAYAHSRGVIHRDLKPANILLRKEGDPVVTDFGIAKTLDPGTPSITLTAETLGTFAYLAPEQRHSSKRVDRRADVFALGAILYESIMGIPPLGRFPWPSEILPSVPGSLQALLERCLAIDPERRFEDAGQLAAEFDASSCSKGVRIFRQSPPDTRVEAPVPVATDRIDTWLGVLENGTTRERLSTVREMVINMTPGEANAVSKMYSTVPERARWGLIRVFGELRIASASHILILELRNSNHREAAAEALGRIGTREAFEPILEILLENPHYARVLLTPLVQTGGDRAIGHVCSYLRHEMATIRLAAVRALATAGGTGAREALIAQLDSENDEKVRREIIGAISESSHTTESSAPSRNAITVILAHQGRV